MRPLCFSLDEQKKIWVGSSEGLYQIEGTVLKKHRTLLPNEKIYEIHQEPGVQYFCTDQKGIVKSDNGGITSWSLTEGLPSATVFYLDQQHDSIFWIATANGLSKLNSKQRKTLFTLNYTKGLPDNRVKKVIILHDTVYALTHEGVSFFNIHKEFKNHTAPKIYIRDFIVDTTSYFDHMFPVIPHDKTYLTFYVSGLSFRQGGKLKYNYRLKGYSDEWKTSFSDIILFTFLPHGTYTFEVVAINEDNVRSAVPASFSFVISEPFWKTTWFILVVCVAAFSTFASVMWLRFRRIRRENRIKEQLANYKQQALTMQMNPHFIFNSLSSIQSYVLSEKPLKAAKYLALFSKLMRNSLQNSRRELISLAEEIELLKLYTKLEAARTDQNIVFRITHDGIEPAKIMLPPMLVQPHVENSIKHGVRHMDKNQQGFIEIIFTLKGQFLYGSVIDNGIGISLSKKTTINASHQSTGIEVTRTRLELLCKNSGVPFIFVISDRKDTEPSASGTIVEFLIPYSNDI